MIQRDLGDGTYASYDEPQEGPYAPQPSPQKEERLMIVPGQIYQSCQPTHVVAGYPDFHTRIKVMEFPGTTPGMHDFGKVYVETITQTGRTVRPRHLSVKQLHESVLTNDGERRRRTGYYLVQDVVHLLQIGSTARVCRVPGGEGTTDPGKVTCHACHEAYVLSGA